MKTIILVLLVLFTITLFVDYGYNKQFAQNCNDDSGPMRLVIIQGKLTVINHPELGKVPASGTVIFQKVGCNSCYIGANADIDGNYKILVGDGKYKVIVRNPSSPEFDMLAPEQERFIDTETLEAKQHSKQVFDFDVKIRLPQ